MANLKKLVKILNVSQGFLKNITKNKKRSKQDFISSNTANACRAVAQFTGYKTREAAEKAIRTNVNLLYIPNDIYAARLTKTARRYGKVKKQILEQAAQAIRTNNYSQYKKLINSNKDLKKTFSRKCSKSINKKLIDQLRTAPKTNRSAAKNILLSLGSMNGKKIVVPKQKLEKEIQRRVKRYGSIASLFWNAAKTLNPKIKAQKLSKQKRKKHKLTNGMNYKTSISTNTAAANIQHRAEKLNKKFNSKLLKTIQKQQKFWAKQAQKQIIAADVLNRLITEC